MARPRTAKPLSKPKLAAAEHSLRALLADPNPKTRARVGAILREGLLPAFTSTLFGEDFGFRKLSGSNPDRDLDSLTQKKALQLVYWLYMTNPVARRITDVNTSFVVGNGFHATSDQQPVQDVLDLVWARNDFDQRLPKFAGELGLYGEQLWPVSIPRDGIVRVRTVDPLRIVTVNQAPDNAERVISVVYSREGADDLSLPVISQQEDGLAPDFGRYVWNHDAKPGDPVGCFFTRVNCVSNAARGNPDLLNVIDWIDAADQFLFGLLERATLQAMLLWDVTYEGTPTELAKYAQSLKEAGPIKPGTVKVHDTKVKWDAKVPDFGSAEYEGVWNLIRQQIQVGSGVPEHWLYEAGDVNRATALAMSEPVRRRLRQRQSDFITALRGVCDFALEVAAEAGRLQGVSLDAIEYEITCDTIGEETRGPEVDQLRSLTETLAAAVSSGLVDTATAAHAWQDEARTIGIEIDTPEPAGTPTVQAALSESYAKVVQLRDRIVEGR